MNDYTCGCFCDRIVMAVSWKEKRQERNIPGVKIMSKQNLEEHLSYKATLAFSIGTSVGWGSLVVTCNTYLAKAGPLGSVLGLICGALVMLVISNNYACLIRSVPESGGAYAYTREVFGYDYGFLAAWFLSMTYLAILWANATSLPLFARIFMGDLFKKVKLYTLFGYDVYLGEALLSIAALVLIGCLCANYKKAIDLAMIIMAGTFTLGIAICFLVSILKGKTGMSPLFTYDTSAISQVAGIAVISPWAFIGFENISHAVEEMSFDRKKTGHLLKVSVILTTALYIMVTLLSVSAYPPEYDNWFEYIGDLDKLSGLKALPPFYAADAHMGAAGVFILMLALLSLVMTSIIGNIYALSRLFHALARDHVLPMRVARLNNKNIPAGAVGLVVLISVFIPFTGRTAIGWNVDVTTIGATLIYGVVSATAVKVSKGAADKCGMKMGIAGVILMTLFGSYLLLPNFFAGTTIARETFMLFIGWSVLGFIFFRFTLKRDNAKRFGSSVIVWVALLSLLLFVAFVWMRQTMLSSNAEVKNRIRAHYETGYTDEAAGEGVEYIEDLLDKHGMETTRTLLITLGMFAFMIVIMLTNHRFMNSRSMESELKANTDTMTGLKNKHAFMTREKEIDELIIDNLMGEFAIVVCDVNGLKKINDTQGHKAGDEYIVNAGRMVCEIFKHSHVYRIGGDEFTAILTGRDYNIRDELMRLLHKHSVQHIENGGTVLAGGISEFIPGEDEDFNTVYLRADSKMYEEKKLLKSLDTSEGALEPADYSIDMMDSIMEERSIINVRRCILIVEEEMIGRETLGNALRDTYEILYARDGIEALEQLSEHADKFALIMTELVLPRMNGVELIGRIKEEPAYKNIPFIVVTADWDAEIECLRNGAVDFIPKPYPLPDLIRARVNRSIELSEDRNIIRSTERDRITDLFNTEYFARYVHLFDHHYPDMAMDAVVVDINRFHMVNERYGREFGDEILRSVGDNVKKLARELKGVGCHQGADTFLLYIPHREDHEMVLDRLSDGLGRAGDTDINISLRIGVYREADKTIDIGQRFYRAKMAADNIRGNYATSIGEYDSKMHKDILFKERLLEDFKGSLTGGQFSAYFQPKFDIRSDTPVLTSAEALVRWDHPEFGLINPGMFIPLLEDHGLIFDLDHYVWEEAAAYLRYCKDTFGHSVPVSVNVSRIDMLRTDLKEVFDRLLEKYSLSPADILLEITESAYTGDSDQVIEMVNRFRDAGFGIEMDDFGTGYSSLGMLSKLPIDALKMDKSFVHNAFSKNRDMRMIELIIDIAEHLKVPVIAEGVETEEQYRTLKEMGCDIIQGYYFSKPLTKDEFNRFYL